MSAGTGTITIQLTTSDKEVISGLGQSITVVGTQSTTSDYLVVCAACAPAIGPTTIIKFSQTWEVFVTAGPLSGLPLLTMQLHQTATTGNVYPFDGNVFLSAVPAYSTSFFGLNNQSTSPVNFGLSQAITINSGPVSDVANWQPLVVMPAPARETSYLQPTSTVYVFLATGMSAGTVVPATMLQSTSEAVDSAQRGQSIGSYIAVDFTTNPTLYFDQINNCFTTSQPASA